ncbi:MAG: flagellar basal body P-ring protein FlgI [Alphaproteobacteria bacterium]|nr:flagellar basal body P-ring protein FlgI [Alphaproteobacteria bacterium]
MNPVRPSSIIDSVRRIAKVLPKAAFVIGLVLSGVVTSGAALAQSRIKDIADFEGIRDNLLVGYGLVVGLNGTGDGLDKMPFTQESLISMMERLGVNIQGGANVNIQGATIQGGQIGAKNIAAVMVTAVLPPFARQGSRIDVTISAMGDAKELRGGTLLVTPLIGADGEVYTVAQGQVQSSGFTAGGKGASVTKGVPTGGRVPNGGIVEREIPFSLNSMKKVTIALHNPDLTTARRVAQAINALLGTSIAQATDPGTVVMDVPADYQGGVVALMTDIEQLRVEPDQLARVVIDDASGTIVIGDKVRISTVAIAQGNLTIHVTETPQVSQPSPFSNGTTQVTQNTEINVDEGKDKKLMQLDTGVSLQSLVNGLNALGVGPRDMITILQAIKAAGALQADIEVM